MFRLDCLHIGVTWHMYLIICNIISGCKHVKMDQKNAPISGNHGFFPLSQLISGHDSYQKDSESVPESYHGHNF